MAKLLCPNITSDEANYSAPVPYIGLYIAVSSLACFLLMLCDVIHGLYRRKTWFPCHCFSLNSLTLTLLAIGAKIPVDLTTSMPSALDQLSKLTGTALLCVSMGFFLPSLGGNDSPGCFTNMVALTILVVTVIVNISMQIFTGLIFSFVKEHVMIMVCMLVLLILLWLSSWRVHNHKETQMDRKRDLFTNGKGSMLGRLRLCYLHGYTSEPQFVLCRSMETILASIPCLICLVVLYLVAFRSFLFNGFKFCEGHSDYGWSMKFIAATQISVILLANLTISSRMQINFSNHNIMKLRSAAKRISDDILYNYAPPILKADIQSYFDKGLPSGFSFKLCSIISHPELRRLAVILYFLAAFWFMIPFWCLALVPFYSLECYSRKNRNMERIQEYRELLRENNMKLPDFTVTECGRDINRWTSASKKSNSLFHLRELLRETPPSYQSLQELNRQFDFKEGNEVSCLHLVFLVRVASVSMPSNLISCLTQSFSEVFDITCMVDTKINSLKFNNRRKCKLAKAMWMGEDFNIALVKILKDSVNQPCHSQSELDRALQIIRELRVHLASSFIWDEIGIIMDFINDREYTSLQELYDYMKQLFVDMLHIFLIQLPTVVFIEVIECQPEEYIKTVGLMLRFLCQIQSLEGVVQWSFPAESNITNLVTTQAFVADNHNAAP